jgi:hypothetical protein
LILGNNMGRKTYAYCFEWSLKMYALVSLCLLTILLI